MRHQSLISKINLFRKLAMYGDQSAFLRSLGQAPPVMRVPEQTIVGDPHALPPLEQPWEGTDRSNEPEAPYTQQQHQQYEDAKQRGKQTAPPVMKMKEEVIQGTPPAKKPGTFTMPTTTIVGKPPVAPKKAQVIKVPEQVITNAPQPQLPPGTTRLKEEVIEGTPPAKKPATIPTVNIVGQPPKKASKESILRRLAKTYTEQTLPETVINSKEPQPEWPAAGITVPNQVIESGEGDMSPQSIENDLHPGTYTMPTTRIVGMPPIAPAIQTKLQNLGYDVGPTGADGKLGPATQKALDAFRAQHPQAKGLTGKALFNAIMAETK